MASNFFIRIFLMISKVYRNKSSWSQLLQTIKQYQYYYILLIYISQVITYHGQSHMVIQEDVLALQHKRLLHSIFLKKN